MQMTFIKQTLLISLSGIILAWVLGSGCSKEDVLAPKADWSCIETGTRPAEGDSPCSDGKRFVKGASKAVVVVSANQAKHGRWCYQYHQR